MKILVFSKLAKSFEWQNISNIFFYNGRWADASLHDIESNDTESFNHNICVANLDGILNMLTLIVFYPQYP